MRPLPALCTSFLAVSFASAQVPSNLRGPTPDGLDPIPFAFVENLGQWDIPARFVARRGDWIASFEANAIAVRFLRRSTQEGCKIVRPAVADSPVPETLAGVNLRLLFEGANEGARLEGRDELPGRRHFLLGDDPARWRANVASYSRVMYPDLYPGVDLVAREESGRLAYDLVLAPGAELDPVVVRIEGAHVPLRIDAERALVIGTPLGPVLQTRPTCWQEDAAGRRVPLEGRYRLLDGSRFAFVVPGRDLSRTTVVDPSLLWSTFLGGNLDEYVWDLALDGSGAPTVAGYTRSTDFPTTPGSFQTISGGGLNEGFVARLSPSGSSLLWATYLGGSNLDEILAVAVEPAGSVTVGGSTLSANFPTTPGAFGTTYAGMWDAFVVRLASGGSSLHYATLISTSIFERVDGLAIGQTGSVTLTGPTNSPSFPTTPGAYDTTFNGPPSDGFVTRLAPSGAFLEYSTFLGGSASDEIPKAVALDSASGATVTGVTLSWNFPTTTGAFGTTYNGGVYDGFVARLSTTGSSLLYSTFLGGSANDWVYSVVLEGDESATVAGTTGSPNFPTTSGAFDTTHDGPSDAFVTRLSPSGAALAWSSFLGGGSMEVAVGLARDSTAAPTVFGYTDSPDFPTTPGSLASSLAGGYDGFVARLVPSGSALRYASFLGGSSDESGFSVELDATGAATVTGATGSPDFPTTPGAFATAPIGAADVFVARLSMLPAGAVAYGTSTPGCAGPLAIGVTSIPQVGNAAFGVTCSNAPPTAVGFLGVSLSPASPPFFLSGALVLIYPWATLVLGATSNVLGASEVGIPVPSDPLLAGSRLFSQFYWFDACSAGGVSASNGLAITVQP